MKLKYVLMMDIGFALIAVALYMLNMMAFAFIFASVSAVYFFIIFIYILNEISLFNKWLRGIKNE